MVDSSLLGMAGSEGVSSCIDLCCSQLIILPPISAGVDHLNLDQGSYHHFAAIGTNCGWKGPGDEHSFLMPNGTETVTDFSHRSIHAAAQTGKQITSVYYKSPPHHSYYNGCSAGGRQGISAAYHYPDDFDGVIAGAPGIDWNNLLGSSAIWASHVANGTSSSIPLEVWKTTVKQEVLRQCDMLDGKRDDIIANPDDCDFDPTTLLCTDEDASDPSKCLTQRQVDGLTGFYKPILDSDKKVLFSRFDPGAEGADDTMGYTLNGTAPPTTEVRL